MFLLSVLDKSPADKHVHAKDALHNTLNLAKKAEEYGYHRFWLAEHHNSLDNCSPAPELMAAWLAGQTTKIRIGSGGVMLQHYSPYKVAENFNLLSCLAPGRIDMGIGKAPGGLPLATQALKNHGSTNETYDFNSQVSTLDGYLRTGEIESSLSDPFVLKPYPQPPKKPKPFLLGASLSSALFAAELGWDYVYAAHINGNLVSMKHTLEGFRSASNGRNALVAIKVILDESSTKSSAKDVLPQRFFVKDESGNGVNVSSIEQANEFIAQGKLSAGSYSVEKRDPLLIIGNAESIHTKMIELSTTYGIDEFIIDIPLADYHSRLKTLRELSFQHFK